MKVAGQHRRGEFADRLYEGLAQADALATQEGQETVWVAVLACRSQVVRALGVKPVRDEPFGFFPLGGIVVKSEKIKRNDIRLPNFQRVALTVFFHPDGGAEVHWWLHAERLVVAHREVVKLTLVLKVDHVEDVETPECLPG